MINNVDAFLQINSPKKKGFNENINNLINTGILLPDYNSRVGPVDSPFVKITDFGKEFVRYLQQ